MKLGIYKSKYIVIFFSRNIHVLIYLTKYIFGFVIPKLHVGSRLCFKIRSEREMSDFDAVDQELNLLLKKSGT